MGGAGPPTHPDPTETNWGQQFCQCVTACCWAKTIIRSCDCAARPLALTANCCRLSPSHRRSIPKAYHYWPHPDDPPIIRTFFLEGKMNILGGDSAQHPHSISLGHPAQLL